MMKYMTLLLGLLGLSLATAQEMPSSNITLHDPTRPAGYSAPAMVSNDNAQYKLSYILASSGRSVAIINGKSLSIGDTINGAQLYRISSDQVWLKKGNETFTISLPSVKGLRH